MKKSLIFLSLYGVCTVPVWAKVDCYDAQDLTFSSDTEEQAEFTCDLVQGELRNKKDRKPQELTACYGTVSYKITSADTAATREFDHISTTAGKIAAYTLKVAPLINSLRAYAIVTGRALCFDTKSYKKPMLTTQAVKEIVSIEEGATELRIPTQRLSIKNTIWKFFISDQGDKTKERAYSYQALVFDEKFVLARLQKEVAVYVSNHIAADRWWVVKMEGSNSNFKPFMEVDDCRFSKKIQRRSIWQRMAIWKGHKKSSQSIPSPKTETLLPPPYTVTTSQEKKDWLSPTRGASPSAPSVMPRPPRPYGHLPRFTLSFFPYHTYDTLCLFL